MRMLILLIVAYAGWCVFLYLVQDRLMFPRELATMARPESAIPPGIERVWIEPGPGVRVEAWLLAADAEPGTRSPAVILTHGNAELIDECTDDARRWNERGFHVLLMEYRGYGRSTGVPGERAIVSDAGAFYDTLVARADVDPTRVYVHGRSLGAAVAAQLAAIRPVAGVVLESGFTSAASYAVRLGAPSFIMKSPFRTDRVLPGIKAPVLLLHSRDDEIVPFSHAEVLRRVRPDAGFVELHGGHNSGLSARREYWDGVDAWLAEH